MAEATEETAFDILRYARERLAPYQRVRRLEFSDLPKTIPGKIRRVGLRGREADLADRGQTAPGEFREDALRGQA
jgi:acetyl-CoA synthetase